MRAWKPHGGKLRALAFSPDGSVLATAAGRSRFVWLWGPLTGELLRKLDWHDSHAIGVAFSPDGRHLASLERNGYGAVWAYPPAGNGPVAVLRPGGPHEGALAFHPLTGALVVGGWGHFYVWNDPTIARDTPAGPLPRPQDRMRARGSYFAPQAIRFTPDGARLVVGAVGLEVWAGDLSKRQAFLPVDNSLFVRTVGVAPDGEWAAVAVRNEVRIARLETAGPKRRRQPQWDHTLGGHTGIVYAVEFTADGRALMTAGADGTVRFWDCAMWQESRRFDFGIGKVYAAAFAPDGLTCAVGSADGRIVVWDVE